MIELGIAALFFVGSHLGVSGTPLRPLLVERLGERIFLVGYSLISLVAIFWLVDSYQDAPYVTTWGQLYALQPVVLALMLLAFLLAVLGLTTPSPTVVGGESMLEKSGEARGVLRVTRHPFLMGVGLWALSHLLVNGDLASLILFGSLLVLSVLGAYSIDSKRAAKAGAAWREFARQTSVMPFVAIARGRNSLKLGELGWWRIALAVAAFLALLHFHADLFGVSPVGGMM